MRTDWACRRIRAMYDQYHQYLHNDDRFYTGIPKNERRFQTRVYIHAPTAHRWSWLCPSCKFVIWHLVRESAPVCPIPRPQLLLLSSYKPESFGDRAQYYRLGFSLVPQCPQHHMNCTLKNRSAFRWKRYKDSFSIESYLTLARSGHFS